MHVEQNLDIPLKFTRQNNTSFVIISNQILLQNKKLKISNNKADFVFINKEEKK